MADTLGPRFVSVLVELTDLAGLAVLVEQLDVVLGATGETVGCGGERRVACGGKLAVEVALMPALGCAPFVLSYLLVKWPANQERVAD